MKILAYGHPMVLSEGPYLYGYARNLLRILLPLCQSNKSVSTSFIFGSRFQGIYAQENPPENIKAILIDEWDLHSRLIKYGLTLYQMSAALFHCKWDEPFVEEVLAYIVARLRVENALERPDLIICYSTDAGFLAKLWPDVPIFRTELGAFTRHYFPSCYFFDHVGIFRNSALARLSRQTESWPVDNDDRALVAFLQDKVAKDIEADDPFVYHDYRRQHERLCLLPLQVNTTASFEEQCGFKTQLEFVMDFLCQTPKDVGVIVTEYNHWGSCIDSLMPNKALEFLRKNPSFIYPTKSKNYASPSMLLAPKVDGVWSVASNVGWFARFYNKLLGTPADSHLSGAASVHDIPSFMARLGQPVPPSVDMLAWIFSRYYIPVSLIQDGVWMYDYLKRRLEACASPDLTRAFVPSCDHDRLRQAWYRKYPGGNELLRGDTESALRAFWLRQQESEAIKCANTVFRLAPFRQMHTTTKPRRYALLNDTKKHEGGRHLGSSMVTDFLHGSLAFRGFSAIPDWSGCQSSRPDLVVFNGEGSLHSNRQRIKDMLKQCQDAKAAGVPVVLINSVFQNNAEDIGQMLKAFDLVTVRESRSLSEILPWRPDARVVPDVSFEAFHASTRTLWNRRLNSRLSPSAKGVVIDCVNEETALVLHDYARFHEHPFLLMGQKLERVFQAERFVYPIGEALYPKLLRSAELLEPFAYGVTGRFHGLILLLMTRTIPLALPSNTHKIEGMLEDIGILDKVLLPPEWLKMGNHEKQEFAQARVDRWTEQDWDKVRDYIAHARTKIASLFDELSTLGGNAVVLVNEPYLTCDEGTWSAAAEKSDPSIFSYGWSGREPWGTWTVGESAGMSLPLAGFADGELILEIQGHGFVNARHPVQSMDVIVNGCRLDTWVFQPGEGSRSRSVIVASALRKYDSQLHVHFEIHHPASPESLGLSGDSRMLGFGCVGLKLRRVEQTSVVSRHESELVKRVPTGNSSQAA